MNTLVINGPPDSIDEFTFIGRREPRLCNSEVTVTSTDKFVSIRFTLGFNVVIFGNIGIERILSSHDIVDLKGRVMHEVCTIPEGNLLSFLGDLIEHHWGEGFGRGDAAGRDKFRKEFREFIGIPDPDDLHD